MRGKERQICHVWGVGCGVWTKIDEHYSNGDGLGGWKLAPKCGMGGWIFREKKKGTQKEHGGCYMLEGVGGGVVVMMMMMIVFMLCKA